MGMYINKGNNDFRDIWARNEYVIHREYATGKGYADLVMIPRRNVSKPALVIELKFNHSDDTAIDQIKRKEYPAKIADYTGDILLVGINYDKESKQHTCKIERYHPLLYVCTMCVRKKHNRSGSTSLVVVSKASGKYKEIYC